MNQILAKAEKLKKLTKFFCQKNNCCVCQLICQQYISKQGEEYYIAYDTIMRRVTTAIRELKTDTFTYRPEKLCNISDL